MKYCLFNISCILSSTGSADNSILYAGYQYDEETGLYYLNARMYDPITARFMQEDTYRGDPNDPLTLNLYTYCANNPLIYSDPSGHRFTEYATMEGEQYHREEVAELSDENQAARAATVADTVTSAVKPKPKVNVGQVIFGLVLVVVGVAAIATVVGSAPGVTATGIGVSMLFGTTAATGIVIASGVIGGLGAITTIFGGSEIVEGATGKNPVKDAVGEKFYDVVGEGSAMLALAFLAYNATTKTVENTNGTNEQVQTLPGPKYPPNNGAIIGTEKTVTLAPGSTVGRYGGIGPYSDFLTVPGDAFRYVIITSWDGSITISRVYRYGRNNCNTILCTSILRQNRFRNTISNTRTDTIFIRYGNFEIIEMMEL